MYKIGNRINCLQNFQGQKNRTVCELEMIQFQTNIMVSLHLLAHQPIKMKYVLLNSWTHKENGSISSEPGENTN
jgi:hypothetical protein